jgi:di/tricarboxylate transporter
LLCQSLDAEERLLFALSTAQQFDVNPRSIIIALALAASASFMTPIEYQTNRMCCIPGCVL